MQKNKEQNKPQINPFSEIEEEVLDFWEKNKIFEKSVKNPPVKPHPAPLLRKEREIKSPQPPLLKGENRDYVFYDGPPFATGTPHYGHIVASIMKDVVPRYWTMQGFRVERRWGWDCHGLPIENIVEKEMGSKSKKDIEKIGVEKFNELCRSKVLGYVDEWKKVIRRLGRWADMENAYKTMDLDFMESVWWVFKELYDKGLIYEGYRSMHICPRCETTLSQQEVAEGYKDIKDLSAVVKFELEEHSVILNGAKRSEESRGVPRSFANAQDDKVYILAWTTTPWTLIGNVALAVGENIDYVLIKLKTQNSKLKTTTQNLKLKENEIYILAKDRLKDILKDEEYEVIKEIKGKDLIGKKYKPLFDYYLDKNEKLLKSEGDNKNIACLVVVRDNKVLLGLREYSKDKKQSDFRDAEIKDFWIVPGGRSEIDESFADTIDRELKEEVNIEKYSLKKYLGSVGGYLDGDIVKWYLIDVEDFNQIKNNEPEKFKEWKFLSVDEIPKDKFMRISDLDYLNEAIKWDNAYKIYAADFVTTAEGTGVVHIAPAFGEDDLNLGKEKNLPFIQHVGMDGTIKDEATNFAGKSISPRAKNKTEEIREIDLDVVKFLGDKIFNKEKYEHSYPHCWRCDTPLINYATSSWFVNILKIKDKILETAKEINWSPKHIKEGRFGKWLEGARDWSISRQRFWASVIPIWVCDKCGEKKVFGSVEKLEKVKIDRNKFYIMRHGETERNGNGIVSSARDKWPLIARGEKMVKEKVFEIKKKNIDVIYASPVLRVQQTAEIVGEELGIKVITDERIAEVNYGELEEKTSHNPTVKAELDKYYSDYQWRMPGGESQKQVIKRVFDFWEEINNKHEGKNILIVSHGDPLMMLKGKFSGRNEKNIIDEPNFIRQGEFMGLPQKITDLHKHVIDKIKVKCKCGGEMRRVPDVLDTWFDSGSMPYAQMHYPFENKEKFEKNFPAEFIAEGIDQTRAWFYYLHSIANGIKQTHAFKNVIVNGIVLAEDGKKMAKKLQNYPDPSFIFEKYGADALRYYLITSPVMLAENLNFAEKGVQESLRNVVMIVWNVVKFYELFANDKEAKFPIGSLASSTTENILDKWILARLNQLISEVTENMNNYNLPKAARPIEDFVNDLSTWYIRRSRDRFKNSSPFSKGGQGDFSSDKQAAIETTRYVLLELSKIMAPFMPFIAEQIWQKASGNDFKDENKSVHLEGWPATNIEHRIQNIEQETLKNMETVRKIVELGLAKRDEAEIKVRQPLSELRITNYELRIEYEDLIMDELNVKSIKSEKGKGELVVELDIKLTPELKLEGVKRELVRFINGLRKDAEMTIKDRAIVYYKIVETIHGASLVKNVFEKFGKEILSDTLSDEVVNNMEGAKTKKEVKVNGEEVVLGVRKV